MKVRYGGDLNIGDFILIAGNNFMEMGWYCGTGSGTLQYYSVNHPGFVYNLLKKEGFTIKSLIKTYIYVESNNSIRVVKIRVPEELFTNSEDLEIYENSKEALLNIKFLKQ